MSTFTEQLKTEISRIAKKDVRAELKQIKQFAVQQRSENAALKRRVTQLELAFKRAGKSQATATVVQPVVEAGPALRFRASGFASKKKKLDLTAAEMAKLLNVSPQSVYHWEIGKSRPRSSQLPAISAVRKMGKKEVTERLSAEV
jgi:DNA-binding transcriptional regulator YiaG